MRCLINKKGSSLLTENVIFIVLNVVFFVILIIFLFSRAGDAAQYEEKYAKQIALLIDAAKPETMFDLNMQDAVDIAIKEGYDPKQIVKIQDNVVTVKLRGEGKGYSYSFFNNVKTNEPYFMQNKPGFYRFVVEGYK